MGLALTNFRGLKKDTRTGVVVNTEADELMKLKSSRKRTQEIKYLMTSVERLTREVNELKELIKSKNQE